VEDCGGNVGDVGGDWDGEFNVVWWCGRVDVCVAAFVWGRVVGVQGELLCLGVFIVMGEEIVGGM
jgi:hypothetical protein